MAKPVLEVLSLTKKYGSYLAVDSIHFTLQEGEILGLLGPNGAGKSTTIQLLLGLTTPDDGEIRYFGQDLQHHREEILQQINFSSAYSKVQNKLTVKQNLWIYAGFYGVSNINERIEELINLFEIESCSDTLFWKLSSGQKSRVVLAKALINRPKILLLDEPTASLDPDIVSKIIDLIRDLKTKHKVSILFTSHNMEEVTKLCDRVIFLQRGKIVAEDSPLGLTKRVGDAQLQITFDGVFEPISQYLTEKGYTYAYPRQQVVNISLPEAAIPAVLFGLSKREVWMTDIDINKPTLEDVFLQISRGEQHVTG